MGGFINGPVVLGWAASNASPDTVRAMVGAVVTGLGGIGSIAGVWAYVSTDAPSGYHAGNTFNLSCAASLCVGCISLMLYQRFENAKRERGERNYRLEKPGVDTYVLFLDFIPLSSLTDLFLSTVLALCTLRSDIFTRLHTC